MYILSCVFDADVTKFWRLVDLNQSGVVNSEFIELSIPQVCAQLDWSKCELDRSSLNFCEHILHTATRQRDENGIETITFLSWAKAYFQILGISLDKLLDVAQPHEQILSNWADNKQMQLSIDTAERERAGQPSGGSQRQPDSNTEGSEALSAKTKHNCTQDITGNVCVKQTMYICYTCNEEMFCKPCSETCHVSHDIEQIPLTLTKACRCLCYPKPDQSRSQRNLQVYRTSLCSQEFSELFESLWARLVKADDNLQNDRVFSGTILTNIPEVSWDPTLLEPSQMASLLKYLM